MNSGDCLELLEANMNQDKPGDFLSTHKPHRNGFDRFILKHPIHNSFKWLASAFDSQWNSYANEKGLQVKWEMEQAL